MTARIQLRVWACLAVLALAAGGAAYAQRPATTPDQAPEPVLPHHAPLPLDAARI